MSRKPYNQMLVKSNQTADGDVPYVALDSDASFPTYTLPTRFGSTKGFDITPTVSTSPAYSANDAVGGRLDVANAVSAAGLGGVIGRVALLDKSKQNAQMDLFLFNQSFTATSDNAPFAPSAADLANCLGSIPIFASDYRDAGANGSIATVNIVFPFQLATGTTLYGQLVTRGTPTYASTTALVLRIGLLQD